MGVMSELIVPAILAVATQVVVSLGLFLWARRVARRQGGVWWQRATWLPLVALGLGLIGAAASMALLTQAFDAVESTDAATKASALAEAISKTMTVTAIFAVPTWLLYAASVLISLFGSLRRPRPSR